MTADIHQNSDTRAPAYDLDSERIVLGALMTDARLVDDTAMKLNASAFYNPKHAEIFAAILAAHEAGKPIEPYALAGYLADQGSITRLGGADYLHTIVSSVPVAAQAGYYVDRVAEMARRRHWEAGGIRLTQAATAPGYTTEQITALAEELLQQAQPRQDDDLIRLGVLAEEGINAIERRREPSSLGRGLPTGFIDLDRLLGGLHPKQLITVAAPTGGGKSIFLLDLARNLSIRANRTVALFSLEMAKEEIFERALSAESRVPHHVIRTGDLTDDDWTKAARALGEVAEAPLYICDQSKITVRQIENKCRKLAATSGLDAVFVDYLQLVEPSRFCRDDQARASDVARDLKIMAGTLDVPVIAAAQMNRSPAGRTEKRPQLSDLRSSGDIENSSNVVIFVHRPDYYDKESARSGEADLIVEKNRSGPTDTVTVAAQLHLSRFMDMSIA